MSPVTIIDLEWQDSRLSWNKSDYDYDFIEVPGSSIWLPYFKIQAIVNEVDLKLRLVSDDYFIDVGDGPSLTVTVLITINVMSPT